MVDVLNGPTYTPVEGAGVSRALESQSELLVVDPPVVEDGVDLVVYEVFLQDTLQHHQFVFEPLALDVKFHSGGAGTGAGAGTRTGATGAEVDAASSAASAVGAAAVLRPADLIDGDTAKASAPQGKPPTAGVIPSHDHCSHTRITVIVVWIG